MDRTEILLAKSSKSVQKMTHTLPDVKSYLPHKRALLIVAAVAILGTLAAVMTVRAETISARQALGEERL